MMYSTSEDEKYIGHVVYLWWGGTESPPKINHVTNILLGIASSKITGDDPRRGRYSVVRS